MTTLTRVLTTAALTTTLVAGAVSTATGASATDDRDNRGTTTVAPSATTASVLLGVTGRARLTKAGAVFPITNVSPYGITHTGGLRLKELDPATKATELTIKDFRIDFAGSSVSAVVNGGARAVVFTVDLKTGALRFTIGASRAITGGPTLAGLDAGTATVKVRDCKECDRSAAA